MARWLAGTIVENRHWTPALFSLRVAGPPLDFVAGQFVRIALDIGGERIARPFSFVNPPGEELLEFYGVIVPQGPLSPHLARLAPGDALFYADNPSGFLILAEVPPAEDLWMVATGTGIAPFLSILATDAPWARHRRVILVHAVRHAPELVYRDRIAAIESARGPQFRYVTFVSRESHPGSLSGRIPAAIRDGRLEAAAAPITPERSHLMLCGNPDMVKDATAALAERGLRKHRRRAPGHITVENFW
jgi:ferredoxin--NADP+ reductase